MRAWTFSFARDCGTNVARWTKAATQTAPGAFPDLGLVPAMTARARLAIVKELTLAMGGTVDVESRAGELTVFTVRLGISE